jgi:hypothetical protein
VRTAIVTEVFVNGHGNQLLMSAYIVEIDWRSEQASLRAILISPEKATAPKNRGL